MRRLSSFALALVAALALSLPAVASTPNQEPDLSEPIATTGAPAAAITDHVKCIVTELREDRILKVWDEDSESSHLIRIAEDVEIKARRKKDFDGRSDLEFADFEPGHRLKLTYLLDGGKILQVKVLEKVDELPRGAGG